jgi:hypothetical protein
MFLCNSTTGWQLPLILNGEKSQITVFPGNPRYKVGDKILAEYYVNGVECCLGDAVVTDIIRYQGNLVFSKLKPFVLDCWAQAEGFPNFTDADKVYKHLYGSGWKERELDCIIFRGSWLPEWV